MFSFSFGPSDVHWFWEDFSATSLYIRTSDHVASLIFSRSLADSVNTRWRAGWLSQMIYYMSTG